jgi:hypothetical protein
MKCRMCSQELTRAGRLCRECERELERARHAGAEIGEVAEVVALTGGDEQRRSRARLADPRTLVLLAFCVGGLAVGTVRLAGPDEAKPRTRSVMLDHVARAVPSPKAAVAAAPAPDRRAALAPARTDATNF